jgi:hypothetical protein
MDRRNTDIAVAQEVTREIAKNMILTLDTVVVAGVAIAHFVTIIVAAMTNIAPSRTENIASTAGHHLFVVCHQHMVVIVIESDVSRFITTINTQDNLVALYRQVDLPMPHCGGTRSIRRSVCSICPMIRMTCVA